MTVTCIPAVGLFARNGLAFPAAEVIENGGPTAPIGVSPGMHEPLRDLVPPLLRLSPLQLEGLGDRLTGYGE
jgi:hypothetical protein